MDIFDVFTLLGGLSLFLFGMNLMGQALEHRAGPRLRALLGRFTTKRLSGLFTGLTVTAIIQSSSAATVMVVGFVNSGLMSLRQAANVIMGANIGTTVTAWILSLSGINSGNFFIKFLKPSSFAPILGLVGILLYLFIKNGKHRDTGLILIGFFTLMTGMETMSGAVSGLKNESWFTGLFLLFAHPAYGVLAGAILTAIIQSSSAAVGILQALALTGQISFGAAIPIIMGQNIGTCATAMVSSAGTTKNAKRAALIHLSFNLIGSAVLLTAFVLVRRMASPAFLDEPATAFGIALSHTVFNVLCTLLLLPLAGLLERLVIALIPDPPGTDSAGADDSEQKLPGVPDERLFAAPAVAIEQSRHAACDMAKASASAFHNSLSALFGSSDPDCSCVFKLEKQTDLYESMLSTYLVTLSTKNLSPAERQEAAGLLKIIGDLERIADHAVGIYDSANEIKQKDLYFPAEAMGELSKLSESVKKALSYALLSFTKKDRSAALRVGSLVSEIRAHKEQLRTRHILRLQQGNCTVETGFVWSDLLTDLTRIADHCAGIAECCFPSRSEP